MKILVISTNHTHPITNGTSKFITEYCDLIRKMGHDVYFLHVTYYKLKRDARVKNEKEVSASSQAWGDKYFHYHTGFLDAVLSKLKYYYRQRLCGGFGNCDDRYPTGLERYVSQLNSKYHFDGVVINYFWLSKLFLNCSIPRQAIMTHDSYTFYNKRNNMSMWFNLSPNEEAKALQRCQYIFAMQLQEAAVFSYLAPQNKVLVSFCNYRVKPQEIKNNHNLLFLSGSFKMNKIGLEWFIKEIFPEICKVYPDCCLKIGGSICKTLKEYSDYKNIELLGFVDNPEDFFSFGDVAINPTYLGAGLKIKTFEALSYGKIVMVHPHCTVGIFDASNAPIFNSVKKEDWVAFLHMIWDSPSMLHEYQNRGIEYMNKMNEFIENQYKQFLA